jgi:hypothetical protein
MSKLIELTNLNADNFLELLSDSNIIIYENIQGTKIFIEYNGNDFLIRNKSITNEPINKIDLALQKYYHKLFDFLDSLDERVKKLLPKGYHFCCQYFPDEKPAHIKYDKLPINNLILTSIIKNGKFYFNIEEIYEFSNLLNITPQPVIFTGILNPNQLELIKLFLYTKKEDIEMIFGEASDNFASFFYKILNPSYKSSILMDEGSYQESLDKLIIKIDSKDEISFSILNPLYMKTDNKMNDYSETYSIILLDFLEFLQGLDFENRYIKGFNGDVIYIDILSDLFNRYIEERDWRIKNFNFIIPPFFYEDKFKLNKEFITNKTTKYLLESSERIEFIFKVLLQSFRIKKNKPIGLFNKNTLNIFNNYVDIINRMIDKALRIECEEELSKHNLLDFSTFFKIKYPHGDGEGKLYPDLYKKIESESEKDSGFNKSKSKNNSNINKKSL